MVAAQMGAMVAAGGDLPVSWLCNSGPSSAFGRSITGGRVIEESDQIVMEVRPRVPVHGGAVPRDASALSDPSPHRRSAACTTATAP